MDRRSIAKKSGRPFTDYGIRAVAAKVEWSDLRAKATIQDLAASESGVMYRGDEMMTL